MSDTPKTGWPPGLLQDDSKQLSKWLASRPDARQIVRENIRLAEIKRRLKAAFRRKPARPVKDGPT
ncbi:hypothetical protein [Polaromonas sp. YR568]|uniref:hypothetical protein n=1 Tax=Polaromonas sp. YR568 TaxID=1855301 RepID=UPI0031380244